MCIISCLSFPGHLDSVLAMEEDFDFDDKSEGLASVRRRPLSRRLTSEEVKVEKLFSNLVLLDALTHLPRIDALTHFPRLDALTHLPHVDVLKVDIFLRFRYSFICQGTSTRRQRRDFFGFRVKLPPVTIPLSALLKDTTSELAGLSPY